MPEWLYDGPDDDDDWEDDDIDDDGQKEFWLFVVSDFGEGAAFNIYEKLEVGFTGDSLIYPFLDGAR